MEVSDIAVAADGTQLDIIDGDGQRRGLSAELLWSECPSAQGRVRRMRGLHLSPPHALKIVAVNPIGSYGVNIAFSDGHTRGIYPWDYLAVLAQRPQLEDFLAG
jgi:prepilin-type processing-associated H-X9-DG protein